jgi:hypothetical protein
MRPAWPWLHISALSVQSKLSSADHSKIPNTAHHLIMSVSAGQWITPSTSSTSNNSINRANGRRQSRFPADTPEWEKIDVTTSLPVVSPQRTSQLSLGTTAADLAHEAGTQSDVAGDGVRRIRRRSEILGQNDRNTPNVVTLNTNFTNEVADSAGTTLSRPTAMRSSPDLMRGGATDRLTITRIAIQLQLHSLFIYALI